MTLQNRVLATGEIVADPARGLLMGNRGILHDANQRLTRARWRHKAWIICELGHKDWHRNVMSPGNYTELFFLDEAVALAAGHRPCKLCRRSAYDHFAEAAQHTGSAPELDHCLHQERAIPRRFEQRRHAIDVREAPDGAIVLKQSPLLVLGESLLPIHVGGYGPRQQRPSSGTVTLLTPPTTCRALANGYRPRLHPDAFGDPTQAA